MNLHYDRLIMVAVLGQREFLFAFGRQYVLYKIRVISYDRDRLDSGRNTNRILDELVVVSRDEDRTIQHRQEDVSDGCLLDRDRLTKGVL